MSVMVIDNNTGRKRKKDLVRSRAAKKAAKKRKGKPIPRSTRLKIAKALRKANKTGRTKYGRKVRK